MVQRADMFHMCTFPQIYAHALIHKSDVIVTFNDTTK